MEPPTLQLLGQSRVSLRLDSARFAAGYGVIVSPARRTPCEFRRARSLEGSEGRGPVEVRHVRMVGASSCGGHRRASSGLVPSSLEPLVERVALLSEVSLLALFPDLLFTCSVINLFSSLPLGPSRAQTLPAKVTPASCGLGYVYDSPQDMGTSWNVQFRTSAQNNTSSPTTATFTSNVDTSVTVTDNLGLTATGGVSLLSVITSSVKASVNASVTESIHLNVGVMNSILFHRKSTANANYGVRVQVVGGHLYTTKNSCNQISWGKVITYVPVSSGWCVWLNSETPCLAISSVSAIALANSQ